MLEFINYLFLYAKILLVFENITLSDDDDDVEKKAKF